jgi:hypothetical protein
MKSEAAGPTVQRIMQLKSADPEARNPLSRRCKAALRSIASLCVTLYLCAAPVVHAATPPPQSYALESLATPQYKGEHTIPLAKDDPYPGRYTLIVSWIPGDDNVGYFRYTVTVAPTDPYDTRPRDSDTPNWEPRDALKRIQACAFTLRVYAPGGRLLSSIPLYFKGDLNWTNEYTTLTANYFDPMPLASYREFLKAPAPASWNVVPNCK